MFQRPRPARGDDRHPDHAGNRPEQFEIVAVARAVGVDAIDHNLTGSQLDTPPCPFDGIQLRRATCPTRLREHRPASQLLRVAPGINREDDTLRAEAAGSLFAPLWR